MGFMDVPSPKEVVQSCSRGSLANVSAESPRTFDPSLAAEYAQMKPLSGCLADSPTPDQDAEISCVELPASPTGKVATGDSDEVQVVDSRIISACGTSYLVPCHRWLSRCATGVFPQALPQIMPQTTRLTNRVPMRNVMHTPNAAAPRREPTSRSTLLSETSAVGPNDLQVTRAVPHRLADGASVSRKARHGRSRSAARPARLPDTAVPNAAELLGAAALLGGKLEPFQSAPLFGERARLRERASSSRKQAASDGDGRPANELAERTVLPAATCPSGRRGQLHIGSLAPMQRRIQPGIRPDVPLLPEALSPHLLVRFVAARSRPCCLASAFRCPSGMRRPSLRL